jgi:hypothetical protein
MSRPPRGQYGVVRQALENADRLCRYCDGYEFSLWWSTGKNRWSLVIYHEAGCPVPLGATVGGRRSRWQARQDLKAVLGGAGFYARHLAALGGVLSLLGVVPVGQRVIKPDPALARHAVCRGWQVERVPDVRWPAVRYPPGRARDRLGFVVVLALYHVHGTTLRQVPIGSYRDTVIRRHPPGFLR